MNPDKKITWKNRVGNVVAPIAPPIPQLPQLPRGGIPNYPSEPEPEFKEPFKIDEPNKVIITDTRSDKTAVKGSIIAMDQEEMGEFSFVTLYLDTGYKVAFSGAVLLKIATKANTKAVIKRMKG